MNEREQGLNYVEEGGQRIKGIFGEGHSLYQRYFSFKLIYESMNGNRDSLVDLSR